jgi:predicted nuclease of restriction endonuclease-like (RecB) superfamily
MEDKMKKTNPGPDYASLLTEVKERVRAAQYEALKAVNTELVGLYQDIGVKNECIFDFLELGEEHSERELERALIARIEGFLRAMGGMFAFMGSQYRLEIDGEEFFIDLLLFHRRLRCLVVIELKIGKFKPEFVGKMQFYLTALDRLIRQEDENPSIGIILCKEKNRTIVEYALHDARKPIGVATYEITRTLPKELKGQLPRPEEIAALMEGIEI